MKVRSDLLCLFVGVILFISCSEQDKRSREVSNGPLVISNPEYGILQDEENPVEFELVDEFIFPEDEDFIVSSIWFFDQDSEGNSYFVDLRQTKLFALTPEGKISWVIDNKGRGPGDLENVMGIAVYYGALYVANINGTRIDVFDLSGNYLKSYDLDAGLRLSSVYGFSDDGFLVTGEPYWDGIGEIITVLGIDSTEVRKISSFTVDQSDGVELPEGAGSIATPVTLHDNQIVSGVLGKYEVNFFNLKGKIEQTITRDFSRFMHVGVSTTGMSMPMGGILNPLFLSDDSFIIRANWVTNISDPDAYVRQYEQGNRTQREYRNTFDLFNPDGTLLYSVESDGFQIPYGKLIYIDKDGFLYFSQTSDFLSISKYKFHFNIED